MPSMSRATFVVLPIGLLSNALLGYGNFLVFCDGARCPDSGHAELFMTIGLIGSIVGLFASWILFGTMFLAMGLGMLATASYLDSPSTTGVESSLGTTFAILGGVVVVVGVALQIYAALHPTMAMDFVAGFGEKPPIDLAALLATGRGAAAVVLSVAETGTTINDNPVVRLTVRLEALDGAAVVEAERQTKVSRLAIPRPGERFAVLYDEAEPNRFLPITDIDEQTPERIREVYQQVSASRSGPVPASGQGAAAASADALDRIAQLNELRLAGALTGDEYAQQKALLLGVAPTPSIPDPTTAPAPTGNW